MLPKTLLLSALLLGLGACQSKSNTAVVQEASAPAVTLTGNTYGTAITAAGAQPIATLQQVLANKDSAQIKLIGTADAVCQAKGCWLTIKTPAGQDMRVRFKDYAFFVPKDIAGKQVVLNGWAHRETIPVQDLKHYAQDAGKSKQEVAAITQPEQQLTFEADGVLVVE